jgi:hypothetical protein
VQFALGFPVTQLGWPRSESACMQLRGWGMKRILAVLVVLCAFFPTVLSAQNVSPSLIPTALPALPSGGGDSGGGSVLSGLPLVKGLAAGKILLNPSVQVGYQHIGTNINLPVSAVPRGPNQIFIGSMDVSLQDFNFWTGTAGLNIIVEKLTLFGSIGGYLPRTFAMSGLVPVSSSLGAVAPNVIFTGSHLQFWAAQCGAAYTIYGDYSILAGYAWSHTAAEFTNPRVGSVPLENQSLRGDVSMNIGTPFVGIQILSKGFYRAALLYSPLARSWGALSLQTFTPDLADLRYSLNQPGTFLAFNAEYYALFKPPVTFSCWFNGTYVNIRGNSDLEFAALGLTAARDVTITNTQYGLAGGVTFGLVF